MTLAATTASLATRFWLQANLTTAAGNYSGEAGSLADAAATSQATPGWEEAGGEWTSPGPGPNRSQAATEYWYGDGDYPEDAQVALVELVGSWLYLLLAGLGILANLAFLYVSATSRDIRTQTNSYLVSLSLSDLLYLAVTFAMLAYDWSGRDQSLLPPAWLGLVSALEITATFAANFTVLTVSVERYLAICHPFSQSGHGRRTGLKIAAIWACSALYSAPFVLGVVSDRPFRFGWYAPFLYLAQVSPYFVCLVVVTVMYGLIGCHLSRHATAIGSSELRKSSLRSTRSVIHTLAVTTAIFFACYLPYLTFLVVVVLVPQLSNFRVSVGYDRMAFVTVHHLVTLLLALNAGVNPIIFNITSGQYRRAFKKAFTFRGAASLAKKMEWSLSKRPTTAAGERSGGARFVLSTGYMSSSETNGNPEVVDVPSVSLGLDALSTTTYPEAKTQL